MRTTATYTLRLGPSDARDVIVSFLVAGGLVPELDEDWDGTALWGSRALRFRVSGDAQDYAFEVHIRGTGARGGSQLLRRAAPGRVRVPRLAVGPRRSLVEVEHLGDALRSALERDGVVEHVEQFI